MLSLSLAGTPDQPLCCPMRCPSHRPTCAGMMVTEIDLRAEGPCFALPVRAIRAKAREHLPSYREPVSSPISERTQRPNQHVRFIVSAISRTVSPSLGSCPASGGASSFLLASALLDPPRHLAISRRARRAMRLTDFCHLDETACTRISCVPSSLRDFHRVESSRSLGLRAVYRGTECFTALANASADRSQTRAAFLPRLRTAPLGCGRIGAWALSSHGACYRSSL